MKHFTILALCALSLSIAACGTKPSSPEEAGHKRTYPSGYVNPAPHGGVNSLPPQ